jgi:hypothetical protein
MSFSHFFIFFSEEHSCQRFKKVENRGFLTFVFKCGILTLKIWIQQLLLKCWIQIASLL